MADTTEAAGRAARAITDQMGVLRHLSYAEGEARVAAIIDRETKLPRKEAALRKIAHEPIGDAEATHAQVLADIVEIARKALGISPLPAAKGSD